MEGNFKKYSLLVMVFCISFISIGTSLFLLNGGKISLFKNRLGASVSSVPSGSLITDVEFYAELVDSYNKEKETSYGYDHNFTEQELASLQTLSINEAGPNYHGNNVESLAGLAYLTGLRNLSIKNVNVSAIDLSHNTSLINLTLYANGITSIDLSANTSIANVDINVPSLGKLTLIGNNSLSSLNTSKPTTTGIIATELGRGVSYLFGGSSNQDEELVNNTIGLACNKYNLAIGESTTCYVKGKTTEQMLGIIFKLQKDNENITIGDETILVSGMSGSLSYVNYGNLPTGEFNYLSFTVTAVAAGTSKISLVDYDAGNPKGYVDSTSEYNFVPTTGEVSKIIYINKYKMTNASGDEVTTGNLKTNYKLNIVKSDGTYESAYNVAVLGDVLADGMINIRDVVKVYDAFTGHGVPDAAPAFDRCTDAEIQAIDINNDGKKNGQDLIKIYDEME